MTEQPAISWEYFNSGDIFILETSSRIFVWIGKKANKMEKFQGGKVFNYKKKNSFVQAHYRVFFYFLHVKEFFIL